LKLPKIKVIRKNGKENFRIDETNLSFNLSEFWSWNQSDLVENRTRGILAEFIVKKALNIENTSKTRTEWDDYDLITEKGIKIEVKSASYIQTWEQENGFSDISFDIKISKRSNNGKSRASDFYVFCLLDCKKQDKINPMKLEQWIFYVKETKEIDRILGEQKKIQLNSLLKKLNPIKVNYNELKKIIQ
jgi:hypothetical protein